MQIGTITKVASSMYGYKKKKKNMHINVNKLKLLVQQVKKQSIVYQVLCVYMCPSLVHQWMWSVQTGERETEIDREKEEEERETENNRERNKT